MKNTDELTPYQIRAIWAKRKFNAEGYVMFWKAHVKKMPDKFALTMLTMAEKIQEKVHNEIVKVNEELSRNQINE